MNNEIKEMMDIEFNSIRKILPKTESIELMVIKGHLVTERLLNEIIELSLLRPDKLKKHPQAFTFSAKVLLVESMHNLDEIDGIFSTIRIINKIRNKYAHHIDPPQVKKLFDDLRDSTASYALEARNEFKDDASDIQYILGYVLGALVHLKLSKAHE